MIKLIKVHFELGILILKNLINATTNFLSTLKYLFILALVSFFISLSVALTKKAHILFLLIKRGIMSLPRLRTVLPYWRPHFLID